ncbi:MAG: hypothetical protein K2I81_01665 [Alphaproteobacteria bacterium]|nr:hypothetical protein [Alphaproteobacteria bacterium]
MKMFYLFGGVFAALVLAYFVGGALGRAECRERIAVQNAKAVAIAHTAIIEKERKIDAETYRIGAGDIRRVLREKYTIAE